MAFADDSDSELRSLDNTMLQLVSNLCPANQTDMIDNCLPSFTGGVNSGNTNIQPILGGIDSNVYESYSTLNRKDLQLLCENVHPTMGGNDEFSDNCQPDLQQRPINKTTDTISSDIENIDQFINPFQLPHSNKNTTDSINIANSRVVSDFDRGNIQSNNSCQQGQIEKSSMLIESNSSSISDKTKTRTDSMHIDFEDNVPQGSSVDCDIIDTDAFVISPHTILNNDETSNNIPEVLGDDNQDINTDAFILDSNNKVENDTETFLASNVRSEKVVPDVSLKSSSENDRAFFELDREVSMENNKKCPESSDWLLSKETTAVNADDAVILNHETGVFQTNIQSNKQTDVYMSPQCIPANTKSQNCSITNDRHELNIGQSDSRLDTLTQNRTTDNQIIHNENCNSVHKKLVANNGRKIDDNLQNNVNFGHKKQQIINLESENSDINLCEKDLDESCLVISDNETDDCCIVEEGTENIRVQDTFSLRTDFHNTDESNDDSVNDNIAKSCSNVKEIVSLTDKLDNFESSVVHRELDTFNCHDFNNVSSNLQMNIDTSLMTTTRDLGVASGSMILISSQDGSNLSTNMLTDSNVTAVSSNDVALNFNIAQPPSNNVNKTQGTDISILSTSSYKTGESSTAIVRKAPSKTKSNTLRGINIFEELSNDSVKKKKSRSTPSRSRSKEQETNSSKGILNCDVFIIPQHFINKKLLLCKKVPKQNKDEQLCFDNVMVMSWSEWVNIYNQCEEYQQHFGDLYENLRKQNRSAGRYLKNLLYDIDIDTFETNVVDQTLVCSECGFAFRSEITLRMHLFSNHSDVFKTLMDSLAPSESSITHHNVANPSSDTTFGFTCNVCNTVCSSKVNLEFHKQLRHKRDEWIGSTILEQMLSAEQQNVQQAVQEPCPILPAEITMPVFSGTKSQMTCKLCDHVASCKSKLMQHFYKIHGLFLEKSNVKCEECNLVLSNKRSLRKHMKTHIIKGPNEGYSCKDCQKYFKNIEQLGKHEMYDCNARTNETLFRCSQCAKPRYFDTKEKLRNHELGHSYSGVKRHIVE